MGSGREFGLHGGPGKGDNSRVSDLRRFKENYDGIDWSDKGVVHPFIANPTLKEFSRKGNKLVKKYS
jgi:hypothetical protein